MKLKIGVMGAAINHFSDKQLKTAYDLGRAIAGHDCITVTGACPGLPFEAAKGASEAGGLVVGISPGLSKWEHINKYRSPVDFHDLLIFTGSGLMGREVVNIRSSDIVVIIGGRSGTLGEFSIAYDEGKLIGVVMGTGGITSEIRNIIKVIKKETGARVLYDKNPAVLVKKLIAYYRKEHYKYPNAYHSFVERQAQKFPAPKVAGDVKIAGNGNGAKKSPVKKKTGRRARPQE